MIRCAACAVDIEGDWARCPLCGGEVTGTPVPAPMPTVPLVYSRRRLVRLLLLLSLLLIVASFGVQLVFGQEAAGIGGLRSVWLGVCTLWLLTLAAVRERRNIARGTLVVVVLVGLVCAYWDYLTGWHGWSLSFTVPLVSTAAIIAVLVAVHLLRVEVGEHILYSGLIVLLGLVPMVFLALGWVEVALPSAICGVLSVVALVHLQLSAGASGRHELAKRLHL